jgi:hypothetical protein
MSTSGLWHFLVPTCCAAFWLQLVRVTAALAVRVRACQFGFVLCFEIVSYNTVLRELNDFLESKKRLNCSSSLTSHAYGQQSSVMTHHTHAHQQVQSVEKRHQRPTQLRP